jgi:hypothetical protein
MLLKIEYLKDISNFFNNNYYKFLQSYYYTKTYFEIYYYKFHDKIEKIHKILRGISINLC